MCSSDSTVLVCKVDKSFINALCVHQQALVVQERELYSPSVHAAAALHLFHRFPPESNYGYGVGGEIHNPQKHSVRHSLTQTLFPCTLTQ